MEPVILSVHHDRISVLTGHSLEHEATWYIEAQNAVEHG